VPIAAAPRRDAAMSGRPSENASDVVLSSWPAGGTKSLNMTLLYRDSIETPPADTYTEIEMASTKLGSVADVKDPGQGLECTVMLRTWWPPPPMSVPPLSK